MVDDPYLFGQIAAANALSDIYAMGGKPITAMNIAAFPHCLSQEVLSKILLGGAHKAVSYTHLDVYKRQGLDCNHRPYSDKEENKIPGLETFSRGRDGKEARKCKLHFF